MESLGKSGTANPPSSKQDIQFRTWECRRLIGLTIDKRVLVVLGSNPNSVCEQIAFVPSDLHNQSQSQVGYLNKREITDRFVWKAVSDSLCEICRHDGKLLENILIYNKHKVTRLCRLSGEIKADFAEPCDFAQYSSKFCNFGTPMAQYRGQWHPITSDSMK